MAGARKSWFLRSGRVTQGPVSSAELQQLARAGRIGPMTEVAQAEDGPWRTAREVRGLAFPTPELPPLDTPSPFNTFAEAARSAPPQDTGVLLEEPRTEGSPPEPPIAFDAAPPPTGVHAAEALPGLEEAELDLPPGAGRQYPEYAGLKAYGWLLRILGVVSLTFGGIALFLTLLSLTRVEGRRQEQVAVIGATACGTAAAVGLSLLIAGDAILAFLDLVRDARRQRIAAERTASLLEQAFTKPGETPGA